MKKIIEKFKKIEWTKRVGKSDKGTSDYVKPVISASALCGTLALALIIAIIVI